MMLPWMILTGLTLTVLLVAEYRENRGLIYFVKPLASTGFLGVAIAVGGLENDYGRAILLGLALSWLGDVFLMFKANSLFLFGLASFLMAHIAYSNAFIVRGQNSSWTVIALVLLISPAVAVARWLQPHLSSTMKKPVWAYIVIITVMLSLSVGTLAAGAHPSIFSGALAFYLSDLLVARDRFVIRNPCNRMWGLPLYYTAQLLLAASIAL